MNDLVATGEVLAGKYRGKTMLSQGRTGVTGAAAHLQFDQTSAENSCRSEGVAPDFLVACTFKGTAKYSSLQRRLP